MHSHSCTNHTIFFLAMEEKKSNWHKIFPQDFSEPCIAHVETRWTGINFGVFYGQNSVYAYYITLSYLGTKNGSDS